MGCENVGVQLAADLHVNPGARYEVCSFPGTSSGQPFVVLGVGDLCVFFDTEEAICELIDALTVAGQELVIAIGRQRVPAVALVGESALEPVTVDRSIGSRSVELPQLTLGEPRRPARPARPGWTCPELLVGGGSDWLSINETAARGRGVAEHLASLAQLRSGSTAEPDRRQAAVSTGGCTGLAR